MKRFFKLFCYYLIWTVIIVVTTTAILSSIIAPLELAVSFSPLYVLLYFIVIPLLVMLVVCAWEEL